MAKNVENKGLREESAKKTVGFVGNPGIL